MSELHEAARKGNVVEVVKLLQRGVLIDEPDVRGWTALHHAVWKRKLDTTRYLLAMGAGPLIVNDDWNTPAEMAAFRRHSDIQDLFSEYGAKMTFTLTKN